MNGTLNVLIKKNECQYPHLSLWCIKSLEMHFVGFEFQQPALALKRECDGLDLSPKKAFLAYLKVSLDVKGLLTTLRF